MYDKYKNLGTGAFGAVFQNPDDPSKVFKVQRQPSYYEQGRGDAEFETQKTAAQMGVAPNIYSVTNFPTKKLTPLIKAIRINNMGHISLKSSDGLST